MEELIFRYISKKGLHSCIARIYLGGLYFLCSEHKSHIQVRQWLNSHCFYNGYTGPQKIYTKTLSDNWMSWRQHWNAQGYWKWKYSLIVTSRLHSNLSEDIDVVHCVKLDGTHYSDKTGDSLLYDIKYIREQKTHSDLFRDWGKHVWFVIPLEGD